MVVLDCGHEPTPSDVGSGWAEEPKTGIRRCYQCATTRERDLMSTARRYTVYVRESDNTVTTWAGGKLGTITTRSVGPWRYTTHARYRLRYVRVTDMFGNDWHGRGNDDWDCITLYRVKG